MKSKFFISLIVLFLWTAAALAGDAKVHPKKCTFQEKKLYGKIQVVDSFPDLKIQVVESFPDLKVKWVKSFPDKCGLWQKVDSFPDLKIQYVKSFPDLKVQFVESFPGVP